MVKAGLSCSDLIFTTAPRRIQRLNCSLIHCITGILHDFLDFYVNYCKIEKLDIFYVLEKYGIRSYLYSEPYTLVYG